MATEEAVDRRAAHIRGLKVTTIAALAGIAAGLASAVVVGTTAAAATDRLAVAIVGVAILVQLALLRVVGVDMTDFSTKDYLYVAFMTFALWFITWAILLTSETTVPF